MSNMAKERSLYRTQLTRKVKGGQKLKNCIFGGCVISMLPKLGEMLEGIEIDLRLKFGPLSAL